MTNDIIEVAVLDIGPTHMVRETSSSSIPLGKHASKMTMYRQGDHHFIEWDIPSLDQVEQIGLTFEQKRLTDYDGVFSLPKEAVKLIRQCGFVVPREFTT